MKDHIIKSGPPLSCTFKIENGNIVSINLSPSSKGFFWNMEGEIESNIEEKIHEWLSQYCQKKEPEIKLPLDLSKLSPFTFNVLTTLQKQPFGTLTSYKDLAKAIDCPKGARAVGQSVGRNPFLLIIPCHRVITSNGALGGFSAGLELKKNLIQYETKSLY